MDSPNNSLAEPNVVSEPNFLLAYSFISTIVVLNLDTLSSNDIAPSFCKKYPYCSNSVIFPFLINDVNPKDKNFA